MTPWTERRRARLRRPDGCYDRERLGSSIAYFRRRGLTLPQIAAHTGIKLEIIRTCSRATRSLERAEEAGLVRLAELAPELGTVAANVALRAAALGIPVTRYGRYLVVAGDAVPALRAHYAERIDQHTAAGWVTLAQAAQMLDLSRDALEVRLRKPSPPFDRIRRARVLGAPGNTYRYDPDTVRAVRTAQPILPRKRPAGTLSSLEVCRLLGVSRAVPKGWAGQGAPHTRTLEGATGFLYFPPVPLADWLSQSRAPTRRSFAKMLRAYAAGSVAA